jgi:hypothetical protein
MREILASYAACNEELKENSRMMNIQIHGWLCQNEHEKYFTPDPNMSIPHPRAWI